MSDKKQNEPVKKRRAYETPAIESEETFERQAVLGCGKVTATGPGNCLVKGQRTS